LVSSSDRLGESVTAFVADDRNGCFIDSITPLKNNRSLLIEDIATITGYTMHRAYFARDATLCDILLLGVPDQGAAD
jgi:hypothetical protein